MDVPNGCRGSNIRMVTLFDWLNKEPSNLIKGWFVMENTDYKTSYIYGEKVICMSPSVVKLMEVYVTYIRGYFQPNETEKDNRKRYTRRFLFGFIFLLKKVIFLNIS